MLSKPSLTAVVLGALLSGCIAAGPIEDAATLSPSKPVVFGNVRVLFNNEPQKWSREFFFKPTNFWLLVMQEGAREASSYRLNDTAEFRWSLAPGRYNLVGHVLRHYSSQFLRRTWAEFTVPANASAVYISDITISLVGDTVAVTVTDNAAPATARLQARFPKLKAAPVKSLLRFSEGGGSNRWVVSPCDAVWSVQCDGDWVVAGNEHGRSG